jgi:acetyl esterase
VTSLFLVRDADFGGVPNTGAVDVEERSIAGGPTGVVSARIVRPKGASETLAAIIYMHGGGWTDRKIGSDERLVPRIANAAHAAVIVVNDRRARKASRHIVIEKAFAAAKFVAEYGSELNVDSSRIGIAGDSIGGDMTALLALLAEQRGFPTFRYQVLFTPLRNAGAHGGPSKRETSGPWVVRTIFATDTRGIRSGLFMGARGVIVRPNAA